MGWKHKSTCRWVAINNFVTPNSGDKTDHFFDNAHVKNLWKGDILNCSGFLDHYCPPFTTEMFIPKKIVDNWSWWAIRGFGSAKKLFSSYNREKKLISIRLNSLISMPARRQLTKYLRVFNTARRYIKSWLIGWANKRHTCIQSATKVGRV